MSLDQLLWLIKRAAVVAMVVFASSSAGRAEDVVFNPDSHLLYFIHEKLANEAPDFERYAQLKGDVHASDEFHRSQALENEIEKLKSEAARVADTKWVIFDLKNTLGEYDLQYNEFDFDINDRTYVSYTFFGRELEVHLINGTAASGWRIDPSAAKMLVDKMGGHRSVELRMTMSLEGSPLGNDASNIVINTRIVSYEVWSADLNTKLGSVIVGQ